MKNLVSSYVDQFRQDRQKQIRLVAALAALAVVVAGIVFWQLHSTGVAMTNEVFCGMEEHTHGDECYEEVLICDNDDEDHVHGDQCYARMLVCDKVEHTHTIECMIDENADLETAADWEATLPALTGNQAYDVVSIAQSQVGYSESEVNFQLADDGVTRQGYTRYGEWYGNAYGDWDAMFASFCLNYADVSDAEFPESSGVYAWMTELDQDGLLAESGSTPARGDLVFLDTDGNDEADIVAVVTGVDDGTLTVIQGNSNNVVEQYEVGADASAVVAYGLLPAQKDAPEVDFEVLDNMTQTIAEEESLAENTDDHGIMTLADGTGEVLDGDYAYLTNVGMDSGSNENGYAMTTGTAPWDVNDDAGNDSSATNGILRTFDVATYTVDMTTNVREDAPYGVYVQGDLYFEFLVEGTKDEVQWETGSMGWLESKHGVYTVSEETYGEKSYQVLRGYITLEPGTSDGHAIGNTTQSLTLALRALSMKNEDTVTPEFTFFMAYNNVGLTTDQYNAWGSSSYNGPIVTFEHEDCGTEGHGTEYHTVVAPDITISAAPRYNLLINVDSTDVDFTTVQSFDFSSKGNEYAVDKDAGEKYGRLSSFGIALDIVGKDATNGLRGAEIPKDGEKITATFTLDLSSQYTSDGITYQTDGTDYNLKTNDGSLSDYAPLIWSFDQNWSGSTQKDDRTIPGSRTCSDGVPYNYYNNNTNRSRLSCYSGGGWYIAETDEPGIYEVTIEDCTVNMQQLPSRTVADSASKTYFSEDINYDPLDDTKNDYWEVEKAVLSAGECWVLQPFYAHEKTSETGEDSTYIASIINDGTFNVYLKDSELAIKDEIGGTILEKGEGTDNQTTQTDDSWTYTVDLTKPGSISQNVVYLKYNGAWNDALIDGCYQDGKDWILQGGQLTLYSSLSHRSAEANNTGIANDQMIKFDDAFFEPDGTYKLSQTTTRDYTILWAAKEDGTGWDHQGLSPDKDGYDEEMIYATPDDLIYYPSLEALQVDGKTCVGVLFEYRGLASEQREQDLIYINGHVKDGAEADQVYMITLYGRLWNRDNLAAAMAADPNSEYYNNESGALNALLVMDSSEIEALAKQYIPSKANNDKVYADDYPSAHWVNGGRDGTSGDNGVTSNTIRNYKKAYYTENGFDGNGTGVTSGYYYGDSCLLVSYQSGLTLEVAQQTTSGDGSTHNKTVFDMDTNQTVVDYDVSPFITRNSGEGSSEGVTYTDVTVTVELPENMTYIDGSSYIGGTYSTTEEGKQGTVTGGTLLTEGVPTTFTYTIDGTDYTVGVTLTVTEVDGKQILTYDFTNVPVTGSGSIEYLEKIYFSCEISSGAVKNNDELDVTASIYCSEDKNIDLDLRDNSESTVGIQVSKTTAISLVKTADQTAVEVNDLIGYTMDIGDNSENPMTMVAVDNIPFNGDGTSTFINDGCEVYVTEFSTYDVTSTRDLSGFFFFYTTEKSAVTKTVDGEEQIKTSADYPEGEYFVTNLGDSNAAVNQECLDDGWVYMEMSDEGKDAAGHEFYDYTDFPEDQQVYAIVGVGIVSGDDDINMHVTLKLSDPDAGDVLVNRVTQQHGITTTDESGNTTTTYADLSDTARVRVVGRIISGTVWLDEDVDGGIRTGMYKNEQLLSGVQVVLQTQDEKGNWVTAQKLKYDANNDETADCVTTTDRDGYYEFRYVPEGNFRIVFSGTGTGDGSGKDYVLLEHDVTIYKADGISDKDNSKVMRESLDISPNSVTYYDDSSSLDYISGIEFSAATSIPGDWDEEYSYQNAGYTKSVDFTVNKVWRDLTGTDITAQRTTGDIKVKITADPNPAALDETVELNTDNNWTATISDLPYYDGNGTDVKYSAASFNVEEIEGADGYVVMVGDIIQDSDNSYSVTITNQASTEMPYTGGSGTWMYTAAGLLLIAGAASVLVYRKRKAVK